ncbi:MAG: rRNA maturation RNase YbeY, partial [Psychrobacter sp.]
MTYLNDIDISSIDTINDHLIDEFYRAEVLQNILSKALTYIDERVKDGLTLPYFADIDIALWRSKPKALDIYITDMVEGKALNLEARG